MSLNLLLAKEGVRARIVIELQIVACYVTSFTCLPYEIHSVHFFQRLCGTCRLMAVVLLSLII